MNHEQAKAAIFRGETVRARVGDKVFANLLKGKV